MLSEYKQFFEYGIFSIPARVPRLFLPGDRSASVLQLSTSLNKFKSLRLYSSYGPERDNRGIFVLKYMDAVRNIISAAALCFAFLLLTPVPPARRVSGGRFRAGPGLRIARKLVEAMHGKGT